MIAINDEFIKPYLTPYKYPEPVLVGSGEQGAFDEQSVDIPFVFRHNDQFYMLYTGYDGKGYQSGVILGRDLESDRWDRVGAAATWMIKESDNLYDIPRLRKVDGKYWLVYHSYPMSGYEEGPAEIGMAWCEDEELMEWHRMDAPVYS
jgi:predicted GH43/DUF377 family glycosyl hydrolase